jgi:hypothetical protein
MADDEAQQVPETIEAGDDVIVDADTGKLRRARPGETPLGKAAAALEPDDAYATHVDTKGGIVVVKATKAP